MGHYTYSAIIQAHRPIEAWRDGHTSIQVQIWDGDTCLQTMIVGEWAHQLGVPEGDDITALNFARTSLAMVRAYLADLNSALPGQQEPVTLRQLGDAVKKAAARM